MPRLQVLSAPFLRFARVSFVIAFCSVTARAELLKQLDGCGTYQVIGTIDEASASRTDLKRAELILWPRSRSEVRLRWPKRSLDSVRGRARQTVSVEAVIRSRPESTRGEIDEIRGDIELVFLPSLAADETYRLERLAKVACR